MHMKEVVIALASALVLAGTVTSITLHAAAMGYV